MTKKTYYHTCKICGANLDPRELCDCEKTKTEKEKVYDSKVSNKNNNTSTKIIKAI